MLRFNLLTVHSRGVDITVKAAAPFIVHSTVSVLLKLMGSVLFYYWIMFIM